jgi:deoxyribodipyrimidine photolyase-related protein
MIRLLLTNHLNQMYINHDETAILIASKEQFNHFRYHQFRIIYHLSAAKHFSKEMNIPFLYKDSFDEIFNGLDSTESYVVADPHDVWLKDRLAKSALMNQITLSFSSDPNFFIKDITLELKNPPYKLDPYYKRWRHRFNILIDASNKPIGGKYSYDQSNREPPPISLDVQPPMSFEADEITISVSNYVKETFVDHPKSNLTFKYPVTTNAAEKLLDHFIKHRLKFFGIYQDAMMINEPFMVHSLVSASINLGLLSAVQVVKKVEQSYHDGIAPLEAVEGFIRQVLGWREYIRGIYLKEGISYIESNHLNNQESLPGLFYTGNTDLNCMKTVINETLDYAYNHHIQRLMILSNISNLMEIKPFHIRRWFNEMYIDSFDWVVTPNVIGMGMFADGGLMSTKPYISSANYINKMSNYCKECKYNPKEKTGENACPINAMYYQFLGKHESKLSKNHRMGYMLNHYKRLSPQVYQEMLDTIKIFKNTIK